VIEAVAGMIVGAPVCPVTDDCAGPLVKLAAAHDMPRNQVFAWIDSEIDQAANTIPVLLAPPITSP
jgi:hypothetical protein